MQNYVQKGNTLTAVAPYALLSGGGWHQVPAPNSPKPAATAKEVK